MKFKYKKIIIIITMCTMCIGLVTISLSTPKENQVKQTTENNGKHNGGVESEKSNTKKSQGTENSDKDIKVTEETKESNVSKGKSGLKVNADEKIDKLIKSYLNATLACDKDTLENIVTKVENVDMEELEAKKKLIEEYQNVECYSMEGIKEGDYLVYVYSELKFVGVATAAPGLMRLYVITEEDGTVKIELGLQSQKIRDLIAKADESEDVKEIINTVNYKLEEAINNDSTLRDFYSKINGGSDEVENDGQESANYETTTPTDEPLEDTEAASE